MAMAEAAAPVSSSEPSPAAAMPAARRRRLDNSGRYQSDLSASSSRRAADPVADPTAAAERPEGNAHGGARRRRVPVRLTINTQIAHEAWPNADIATDESFADEATQGADDTAVIEAIRQAVPGPHKSKSKHYEALLDVNDTRAEGQKWPDKSMQKAAGIHPSNAKRVRDLRAPDTPRTAQARSFLEGSTPAQGADSGLGRYRRLLIENDTRADDKKWPDKSLRKAAGIVPVDAKAIRDLRTPDTPRTAQARSFMDASAPAQGTDSGFDRYRRGLNENDRRTDDPKWPDKSLRKAAGIAPAGAKTVRELRAPDTPRTAQARSFMDGSAPAQGTDSALGRYRRGLNENDTRTGGQKWPDKSLQKAAGIAPADAKTVRELRAPDTPRTAQARSFMDASAPAQGADSASGRYRRGLDENDRRTNDQKWPDKSIQKAAGILPKHAKKVLDRRIAGHGAPVP
ncbi:MAG: hypothetical protein JF606_17710 [Burkholderiales bacterium]|nr:hypothetical protein [Burkholderiales bacterium]